ncbi:MAG: transcription termination factor NusA [Patescibacteria group bacterium]
MAYIPRTEFATALTQVATERGIEPEVVLETIKAAIVAAYRRDARERGIVIPEEEEFEVEINPSSGEAKIFQKKGKKREDITPPGFGRIAAQTAKQVILQKIREAEKSAILDEYSQRIGTLVSGMILRFDGPNIVVDIGKTEAVMPPSEQVRSEGYKLNQRLTFYIEGIKEGPRGQQIIVSRASRGLVEGLFKREVPEVSSGAVEIAAIAREPGGRTKIAVFSNQAGVDPVGSCVGQKGVRVQEVIEELNGEKIDIIQHSDNPEKFITASLSPAQGISVELNEKLKTAKVVVPGDQLSLAIGKKGENVRLAAKLTGYKIDIMGEGEGKPATPASAPPSPKRLRRPSKATAGKQKAQKKTKKTKKK